MIRIFATALVCALAPPPGPQIPSARADGPGTSSVVRVLPNDNRLAAGKHEGRVLTVRLYAGAGDWHPDGERDPGLPAHAFGEVGRPLQVPGPLLRVREGTTVHVSLRNDLAATLIVHGLYARAGAAGDSVVLAPKAVREVTFEAGAPGTYYYWGTTTAATLTAGRPREDSQLYGALVIDPREGPSARDRIFVIGFWTDSIRIGISDTTRMQNRFVINGKSWPATERLVYDQGETVRWRLINATHLPHPMHLHGTYFQVLSRGSESADTIYPSAAAPDMAFTERMPGGGTISMSWLAARPGYWLFHCHDNLHFREATPLAGTALVLNAAPAPMQNHALESMSGLVMGVEVRPKGALAPPPEPHRHLRLIVRADSAAPAGAPAYAFVLRDLASGALAGGGALPAPPLVLQQGEPVSITVVNQLPEPTSVHWHGIELDSYYDGVPGFAGHPGRIAPAIAPGDSFEVRFAPPRAGTFIYHTHFNEMQQTRAGLAGALIVLEPGTTYEPQTDISIVLGTPRAQADELSVALNGSTTPPPLQLQAGRHYRLRLINMHTYRGAIIIELAQGSTVLSWRPLAKDGVTLAGPRATERAARLMIGIGETYDFELAPSAPGALRLDFSRKAPGGPKILLNSLPIVVH